MMTEEQTVIRECENEQFSLGQIPGEGMVCIFTGDPGQRHLVHRNPKQDNDDPTTQCSPTQEEKRPKNLSQKSVAT